MKGGSVCINRKHCKVTMKFAGSILILIIIMILADAYLADIHIFPFSHATNNRYCFITSKAAAYERKVNMFVSESNQMDWSNSEVWIPQDDEVTSDSTNIKTFPVSYADRPGWLIEGYANSTSVSIGDDLSFHLSTSSYYPELRRKVVEMNVYNYPFGDVINHQSFPTIYEPAVGTALIKPMYLNVTAQHTAYDSYSKGCNWPVTYTLHVPANWLPGVYIARFTDNNTLYNNKQYYRTNYQLSFYDIQFIVRLPLVISGSYSRMLLHVSSHTAQAYNVWTGHPPSMESFYEGDVTEKTLSYDRPFAARAHEYSMDRLKAFNSFSRPYDNAAIHLSLVSRWELVFIRWLHQRGIPLEIVTSVELHNEGDNLLNSDHYNLFLSVGHDEYWSDEMRDAVEHFIQSGGNVMFMGGNTMYWRVRSPRRNAREITMNKEHDYDLFDSIGRPTSRTVGASYGGQREGRIQPLAANLYDLIRSSDPLLAPGPFLFYSDDMDGDEGDYTVNLNSNSNAMLPAKFGHYSDGHGSFFSISGYEVDSLEITPYFLSRVTTDYPASYIVLGFSASTDGSIGYYKSHGAMVFSGATTDFVYGLADSGDLVVTRIVQNAISSLNTPPNHLMELYEFADNCNQADGVESDKSLRHYYSLSPFTTSTSSCYYGVLFYVYRTHMTDPGNLQPLYYTPERNYFTAETPHSQNIEQKPLFYAYKATMQPHAIRSRRLVPVYQSSHSNNRANNTVSYLYTLSHLPPSAGHLELGQAKLLCLVPLSASWVNSYVYSTSFGLNYAYNVEPYPVNPFASDYMFHRRLFQVVRRQLSLDHHPVCRFIYRDESGRASHEPTVELYRLNFCDSTSIELLWADGWVIDSIATPDGDGILFYATRQPDPSIYHVTPVYQYKSSYMPRLQLNTTNVEITHYAYDYGGAVSSIYSKKENRFYQTLKPSIVFYVLRPAIVPIHLFGYDPNVLITSSSFKQFNVMQRYPGLFYGYAVSPYRYSFPLSSTQVPYSDGGEVLFHAFHTPIAGTIPIFLWKTLDNYNRYIYRLHPNLRKEMIAEIGNEDINQLELTKQDWILDTSDRPDGILFYAFPSSPNHDFRHYIKEMLPDCQLLPVYEHYMIGSPFQFVAVTVSLSAIKPPAGYQLLSDEPLFYVPSVLLEVES